MKRRRIYLASDTSCGPDADGNTIDEATALGWAERLQKHADSINAILAEAKAVFPEANLYFEPESGLHLMWGDSHVEGSGSGALSDARQNRIICTGHLNADAGAW